MGFFEADGTLLDKWELKTNTENGGANILSDIAKAIDNKLAQEGISKDEVQGIGIGVPGPVRGDGTVNRCVNLGWGVFNVAEKLSSPKVEKKELSILSVTEVESLLEQPNLSDLKGQRDKAMLETLYATGIRVTELISLNMNELNLNAGHIKVKKKNKETI